MRYNKMREFVLKKNLWTLDFITSIIFAILFGYGINLIADSPAYYEQRDLIIGVLAYIIAFIIAFYLQKKIVWLPSWAWLGIFGAFIRILLLMVLHLPQLVEHRLKYSHSFTKGFLDIISDLLIAIAFNWILWGLVGLMCIFTARIIIFLFQTFNKRINKSGSNVEL